MGRDSALFLDAIQRAGYPQHASSDRWRAHFATRYKVLQTNYQLIE